MASSDVSTSAAGPGPSPSFGQPGFAQDGFPLPLAVWPCGRGGQEKPCTYHKLYSKKPGQAPGLSWRAAMFAAVAMTLPRVQSAPCPMLPPTMSGQWAIAKRSCCNSATSSLSAGPRAGPQTLPHEAPGQTALFPSASSPASSLCTPSSLIHSLAKYFIEHLLRARHCPTCRHEPNRQNPAFVERLLWGREFPFRRETSLLCPSCHSLPCRPSSSWQAHSHASKATPGVPTVSGTV